MIHCHRKKYELIRYGQTKTDHPVFDKLDDTIQSMIGGDHRSVSAAFFLCCKFILES